MSYCELKVIKNNLVEPVKEFSNSHGGAAYIWNALFDKYLKDPSIPYDNWMMKSDKLWPLWIDQRLPIHQQIVMGSTYDNVIIEFDKLSLLADYYDKFVDDFGVERDHGTVVCHLRNWAELIREILKTESDETCQGICFYQMSVVDDPWRFRKDYINEDGEEDCEYVPYDLTKGDKHWFLFEEHARKLSEK